MIKSISCVLFSLLFVLFISPHIALASQTPSNASYYSLLKNYLIGFSVIDAYNKRVLGAQTTSIKQPADVTTYMLNAVNTYRRSLRLYPVQSNPQTCAFAALRAREITTTFSHDGFNQRVTSHTIPYSHWSHATENIAEAPNYQEVVTLWQHSPGHAANMRDNTPYVCIRQYGNYFAYEGMRL